MTNINIVAIVDSIEKHNSGYERAINKLARIYPRGKFTAQEVEISGSTLTGLASYGVLKVVGTKKELICIDEDEGIYKRFEVKIYELDCDIAELAKNFETEKKTVKVQKIEQRIANLRGQLAKALADLDEIK